MTSYLFQITSSGCHSVKVLSTTVGYYPVAKVTDLCRQLTYDSTEAWHTVYVVSGIQWSYSYPN